MAEAKDTKTYVNTKTGDTREFFDSVYKNLSKTLKALWVPADELTEKALSTTKIIPPAGIIINSSNKNVDEAYAMLGEVFDELGIAKPDGSILDMAITAAGALRSAHAAVKGAPGKEVVQTKVDADGNTKRANEEKEVVKTIEEYSKAELQDALTKRGIVYAVRDSKEVLLDLLKNAE